MPKVSIHGRYVHCHNLACQIRKRGRHCPQQKTLVEYTKQQREAMIDQALENGVEIVV